MLGGLAHAHPGDEWLAVVPGRSPVSRPHPRRAARPHAGTFAGAVGRGGAGGRPRLADLAGGADVCWIPAPAPVACGAPYVLTVHDRSWGRRPATSRATSASARRRAAARAGARRRRGHHHLGRLGPRPRGRVGRRGPCGDARGPYVAARSEAPPRALPAVGGRAGASQGRGRHGRRVAARPRPGPGRRAGRSGRRPRGARRTGRRGPGGRRRRRAGQPVRGRARARGALAPGGLRHGPCWRPGAGTPSWSPTSTSSPRRWATPRCASRATIPTRSPAPCFGSRGDAPLRARLGHAARERAASYGWERSAQALSRAARARRAMTPFTIVTVTHDSAPDLPALLALDRAFLEPRPQVVVVDSGSRDDGPALARAAGAEVDRAGREPRLRRGQQRGAWPPRARRCASCSTPTASCATTRSRAWRRWPPERRAARPAAARRTGRRPAQRPSGAGCPLGARARRRADARCCPSPTARARCAAWAGRSPPAWPRPPRSCAASVPSIPGAFLFYEDLDLCLRARRAGVPTVLHPELAVTHLGGTSTGRAFGGEAFDLQARRRREVVGARLGPRALAIDDAAQALTFASRAAVGRERARNLAALRALRHHRRQ